MAPARVARTASIFLFTSSLISAVLQRAESAGSDRRDGLGWALASVSAFGMATSLGMEAAGGRYMKKTRPAFGSGRVFLLKCAGKSANYPGHPSAMCNGRQQKRKWGILSICVLDGNKVLADAQILMPLRAHGRLHPERLHPLPSEQQ
jgi:hypothetical protein